jgi:RNA polymerase sigma-70 factor (ECF subfamily)
LDWSGLRQSCVRALVGMGATHEQAEDAAQNAALRAWCHRQRLRPGSDPTPWVLTIESRELMRLWGRAHHERELPAAEPGLSGAVSESIDSIADRLDLQAALSRLEAHDRVLLGLRYERDLSQREVAAVLGIPEGTTKVRLHRVRGKVKAMLGSPFDE